MRRHRANSSAKEQTCQYRLESKTCPNDTKRPLPSPHTNLTALRSDQNIDDNRQVAGFSRPPRNSTFLYDHLAHATIRHPSSSSPTNPHLDGSSSLEIPMANTHHYPYNTPSLPAPPSSTPSHKFPCFSPATMTLRQDHLDRFYSPPETSDISPDPAALPKLYPNPEQKAQSRQSLVPIIKDFPPVYPQSTLNSNSTSLPQIDQEADLVKLGPNGLAEDQPPTAQGKLRTRVYVACLQCRSRKIRCDGAKPKCQKCLRRVNDCDYDETPKRRGPDKKPGARQRTSKKIKAIKDEISRKEIEKDIVAKHESVNDVTLSSSSLNSCHNNPGQSLIPASSHALLPLQNFETYDVDAHRDSVSSSVEYPLPITPVDGPEITLSLPSATTNAEVPNMSFRPDRVDESRLLPESLPLSSNKVSLELGSICSLTSQAEYHKLPLSRVDIEPLNQTLPFPDDQEYQDQDEIGAEPSLDYARKTWWDSLVTLYLPGCDGATSSRKILADLSFLFKASNYFFGFINVPLFFNIFCNPIERDKMQPSLVLSILAVSAFMTSSEIDQGNAGRMRALWLRDAAQSSLEASLNARWIDPTLAQAAWLLALFETCAHPLHCAERSNSSMVILDSIIRSLGLTSIDKHDIRASKFDPCSVPIVQVPASSRVASKQGCCCASLTLGHNSPASHQHTPLWVATAAWNPDWTIAEIRKEESRRLCWSSLQIAAGHTAHAAAFSSPPLDYYCIQPSNYSLLFPGESLLQSQSYSISHSFKESIWALYSRTMLLWNSCLHMRENHVSDAEKANFAVNAWLESTVIEEALNSHTCGCDQAFLFQSHEFLFITRMCISYEFRRFIPHPESDFDGFFNRRKAEEWLIKQATISKRVMKGLHTVTGHKNNVLAQRPFFIWWFMGQVARCLSLWQLDNSLIIALEVCEAFFAPIDYLSCLWPCPIQRATYLDLHLRLSQACQVVGLPSPPSPNFDLFAPGSPPVPIV